MKYRIISGDNRDVEREINELADSYTVQQFDTDRSGFVSVLLRARSEETEPDPEDDWCLGKAKDGTRCLLDSTRDGLCKRHWRDAAAKGLMG